MADTYLQVIFWAFFALMAIAGIRVVTTRNVIHAALYLVATLLGAASMYVLLYAEFVAWVQVLVYVGAVVVLMLFGLMLTRAPIGSANFDNNQRLVAALCAGLLFAVTSFIMVRAFEGQEIDFTGTEGTKVQSIGEAIFSIYVLPFEIVSVLLLAALVGAVVISRRDEARVDS
ncbi:MAG TPA: NADH-quinone oxidoreductase subunit J [Actinomycetota bacterium]|nr:NADH-quinone oxidoreductase subunit J [Actinomycetota bacterium]